MCFVIEFIRYDINEQDKCEFKDCLFWAHNNTCGLLFNTFLL